MLELRLIKKSLRLAYGTVIKAIHNVNICICIYIISYHLQFKFVVQLLPNHILYQLFLRIEAQEPAKDIILRQNSCVCVLCPELLYIRVLVTLSESQ
jgi:hypothetical protein